VADKMKKGRREPLTVNSTSHSVRHCINASIGTCIITIHQSTAEHEHKQCTPNKSVRLFARLLKQLDRASNEK